MEYSLAGVAVSSLGFLCPWTRLSWHPLVPMCRAARFPVPGMSAVWAAFAKVYISGCRLHCHVRGRYLFVNVSSVCTAGRAQCSVGRFCWSVRSQEPPEALPFSLRKEAQGWLSPSLISIVT